ncbi:putative NRPS-like enzyme [Aspergillus mulundensis]|uniref:NRPS-like enzyme, putative (JCVI) n=1 Tax=Aspergillus mulundensis TaxID=1810919 RepID=A0A3D8S3V9_9EURO|nr:NRPS-like enzyme, putative (JCVI) [Aspergillus mulundensis]RDW80997.1 NRPS-like enzyme, putative (JCVI) [Aspergillus mulundensis]
MTSPVGKRLLPRLVDEAAHSSPDRLFGIIPKGPAVSDGFRNVTFNDLAHAVDALAWWIDEHVGKAEQGKETIAYMGANDIRYYIFVLSCSKTGHTPFLPSTRLSDEAYQHVLNATDCGTMLFTHETQRRTMEIEAFRPESVYLEAPPTTDLLSSTSKNYPFTAPYSAMEDKVAFIIHSSGTTGMPKPVPLTHGFLAAWDHAPHIIPAGRKHALYNGYAIDSGALLLSLTPNFHLMGFIGPFASIFHGIPYVAAPDGPLSVQMLSDTVRATKPNIAMVPPSILEDMSHSEAGLDALRSVEFVCLGGAPLGTETGDRIRKYTTLRTVIGSSEIGMISSLAPENEEDWNYFEWSPAYGIEMQHVSDDLHELVIRRGENTKAFQGIFHTFPDLTEYHTKDLFVQHPKNPNCWAYRGRLDDVIVLSNGEKLNPVTLEKMVEGHPSVARAVLVGEKRFQSALLIEPNWCEANVNDEKGYIDNVWPTIQRANETVPRYGRVMRSHIRLASPDKPFKLTPKGTTQRRLVNNDYAEEIDAIYATAAEDDTESLPSTLDLPNLTQWVRVKIATLLDRPGITDEEDFFSAGLDSLQTVQLAKALSMALSTSITQQQVYAHPSIAQLAASLLSILDGTSNDVTAISRTERITNMITKYTHDLPQPQIKNQTPPGTQTVILTGSTGSLGTYLLNALLQDSTISKIYCLNRSGTAQAKQTTSFIEKALESTPLTDSNRVEFLTASLGERNLGLDESKYNALLESVTLIIHNGWTVNFNHPVESFESQIRGVRHFIDFSITSRHAAHIAFVSSVSTIGNWKPTGTETSVPENAMETPDVVLEQGYGESKHVGERICLEASRRAGVPTSILRVGQIAGPTTTAGLWNPSEWVPILLKTSKGLGAVPDSLGGMNVDWIPVDTLATIILEILTTRLQATQSEPKADADATFFHLTNPTKTPWSSLLPSIQASLSASSQVPVTPTPLAIWLNELEKIKNPTDDDIADKPALKLLPFFRGLTSGETLTAEISTDKAQAASGTMAALKGVDGGLIKNWIRQWGF